MAELETLVEEEGGLDEKCGVFACVAAGDWPTQLDVGHVICLGLVGLQHRGQESAGIVTSRGKEDDILARHKGMGMVSTIFTDETLSKIKGNLGIGHTRYSTAGFSELNNCQPFVVDTIHGKIAVAHNGELVNAGPLRQKVMKRGIGLSTGSDSEVITQLLCSIPSDGEPDGPDWQARIRNVMNETLMSYSLVIMTGDCLYAVRDPYGNRPLCIGRLMSGVSFNSPVKNGYDSVSEDIEGWVVSSESCSFQSLGAVYQREVQPGEIVRVTKDGIESICVVSRPNQDPPAFCIFEYVYFARADSIMEGQMVYSVRMRCGRQLAKEAPVEADLVSTVPESATPAAMGYAQQSGIPYVEVLNKNRYVGRTFIQPNNRLRQLGVAKKFGALAENFKGKRIVLIDDSIVRGNTIGPIVRLLFNAGAKEVHIRVASPPVKNPCYMGINIPTKEELIANRLEATKLAECLGATSLVYLTVDGLTLAVREGIENSKDNGVGHCTACLTGKYPVNLEW
ncbi:PPAT [Branchiostoma lanceolatum]|uniref:Amidophosphoribosyltransferase n=1 Tax=Branchiostoma lanceolatum TaxID=7740 RepID=A0A8K0EYS0_BRALA|nr:PPAT [Branchiostoma lanceolatum]